jgi:thiosulfate dehydrogenase
MLRGAPHNYTPAMIDDTNLARLAAFVSRGQHDTRKWIGKDGKSLGVPARGQGVFQNVCAACHGYDGRLLNWGTDKEPEVVGTAANKFPEEFLHKLRNGHPGSIMINLRAFDLQTAADVHAYSQTLPVK